MIDGEDAVGLKRVAWAMGAATLLLAAGMALEARSEEAMPRFERAEVPCMPPQDAEKELMGERYKETPLFDADLPNPANPESSVAVTVFANPTTGTWTLMVSPTNGLSCLIMAGKHFRLPRPRGGRPS